MPDDLRIISARELDLDDINALIARSKAYWAWPDGYLDRALPLHLVTFGYLQSNLCFEVVDVLDSPVAFFSIDGSGSTHLLDKLWVTPELIGKGVGRWVCRYIFALAEQHGWTALEVLPDPQANTFYLNMGFVDTGKRVASRVQGGPEFSVLRWSGPPLQSSASAASR